MTEQEAHKKTTVLTSITAVVCMFIVAAVAVTLALTVGDKLPAHVTVADNISLSLTRTRLTRTELDARGKQKEISVDTPVDFTKATDENIFGLQNGTTVAPGSRFVADLALKNEGETAFTYWVELAIGGAANVFADQLRVTVRVDDDEKGSFFLSEGTTFGSERFPLGTVAVNAASKLTVQVYFEDDRYVNDDAQNQSIFFDLIVRAALPA